MNIEEIFINKQLELMQEIDLQNAVSISAIHRIAGVDLAYWKEGEDEYANCCIVVFEFPSLKIVEEKYTVKKVDVPYIPGCLAFRELPLFEEVYSLLENDVDVFFFDGNGYLHPRHMGLATHAGILINKPTIGIAKSYFKINDVDFTMPECQKGAYTDIIIDGETYGRVLRTAENVKPIFLSIGNKIDLDTAMELTNMVITKDSHIPVPTRMADLMTHRVRKEYQRASN
ncbi:MAG: endonuclease V [Pseudobutyrivibrio sp.]|nr:endonuclease V [Pseudobutyrivibrio sp.]